MLEILLLLICTLSFLGLDVEWMKTSTKEPGQSSTISIYTIIHTLNSNTDLQPNF